MPQNSRYISWGPKSTGHRATGTTQQTEYESVASSFVPTMTRNATPSTRIHRGPRPPEQAARKKVQDKEAKIRWQRKNDSRAAFCDRICQLLLDGGVDASVSVSVRPGCWPPNIESLSIEEAKTTTLTQTAQTSHVSDHQPWLNPTEIQPLYAQPQPQHYSAVTEDADQNSKPSPFASSDSGQQSSVQYQGYAYPDGTWPSYPNNDPSSYPASHRYSETYF